jgi:MFS family permease
MVERALLTLSLYQLLASNRSGFFVVYFPLFLVEEKGATVPVALVLLSLAYISGSLVGPLAGRWSDRSGHRRRFLLAAEMGALPLFVAVPFVPTFLGSGATFLAAQVVLAIGSPALNAYVADVSRRGEVGGGYGLLNAMSAVGAIFGFLLAGAVVDRLGFAALFELVGFLMVGTIGLLLLGVEDRRSVRTVGSLPRADFGRLSIFSLTVSLRAMGAGAVTGFYGTFAFELGATPLEVSFVAISGLVVTALVSVPMGRSIDTIGERRALLYGTAVGVAGMGVYLLASTWYWVIPGRALQQLSFALVSPAMLAWVVRLAPVGRRAEYLGFFSLINSTLWSAGPLFGGLALQAAGPAGLFLFAMAVTIVSLVGMERLFPTPRQGGGSATPSPGGTSVAATGGR